MGFSLIAQIAGPATPAAGGGASGAIDTTGADLIVIVVSANGSITATPSDSKGNTWNAITGVSRSRIFWCKPTSVGTGHTFTFSQADSYPVFNVFAVSGSHATTPFDNHNNGASNYVGGSPATTGSITPPVDGCFIVSGIGYSNAATGPACGPGFTVDEFVAASAGNVAGAAAYLIQGTAAAINASWTQTGDITAGRTIAAFLPAASSGPSAAAKRRYRRTNLLFLPE